VLTLALGVALFAYWRTKQPQEAPKTRKGRAADYVTRDEMEEIIEQYTKELEFTNTEWYEKFNALHQRLAKREKRSKPPEQQLEIVDEDSAPRSTVSALPFRKLGSL